MDLLACFSFESYANLQDLCDKSVKHTVNNALGACYTNLAIQETEQSTTAIIQRYTLNDESH